MNLDGGEIYLIKVYFIPDKLIGEEEGLPLFVHGVGL